MLFLPRHQVACLLTAVGPGGCPEDSCSEAFGGGVVGPVAAVLLRRGCLAARAVEPYPTVLAGRWVVHKVPANIAAWKGKQGEAQVRDMCYTGAKSGLIAETA